MAESHPSRPRILRAALIPCALIALFVPGAACGSCLDWEAVYTLTGTGNITEVRGVAVDGSGNVVTVGYETRLLQGRNWLVRKSDSAGVLVWSRSYVTLADEQANGVAVLPDGRIFVAGTASATGWMVRAYGADGSDLWSDTTTGGLQANAVAVTPDGNVVVAGGNPTWVVREYSAAGAVLWTRTFTAAGSPNDEAHGVAVGPSGIVAAVGESSRGWYVRIYDAVGNEVRSFTWGDGVPPDDAATSVAIDETGNLLIGGRGEADSWGHSLSLFRMYSATGDVLWSYDMLGMQGPGPSSQLAVAVVVGDHGLVYVGGPQGVVGFTATTGRVAWSDDTDGLALLDAALASGPGGRLVVAWGNYFAWATRAYLDPATCPGAALNGHEHEDVLVYPNPVAGDTVRVAVRLPADVDEVMVDVFNVAMRHVFTGTWRNVRQGEGGVRITGLSRWAPGLYYVKARAKGSRGVQGFSVTRLVIQR